MNKTLEECAKVVLAKWPQEEPCERCGGTGITEVGTSGGWGEIPCPAHRNPIPITPAELLADDDDGRPSKWLWALWMRLGMYLTSPQGTGVSRAETRARPHHTGSTPAEAMIRALCELAEAS